MLTTHHVLSAFINLHGGATWRISNKINTITETVFNKIHILQITQAIKKKNEKEEEKKKTKDETDGYNRLHKNQ